MKYPIAEVFKSIQGEGHFVGFPAVFVRFAGCSVGDCHIREECDTDFRFKMELGVGELVQWCREYQQGGIVVLTGGEPSDYNLIPIVDALNEAHFRVHLETSGKRAVTGLPVEWITVSPKTRDYQHRVGHALKVVIKPGMTWSDVYHLDQGTAFFHRYLQPLTGPDGKAINLEQVVEMVRGHQNDSGRWALSVQAHRAWGVR